MLKKLTIHNFKSFYNSTFEFGKLNCLIAPNNTGKSNLIEAIEFIDNLLFKIDDELFSLKDLKNFRHKEENIKFELEFELDHRVLVYLDLIDYKYNVKFTIQVGEINNIDLEIDGHIKSVKIDVNNHTNAGLRMFGGRVFGDDIEKSIDKFTMYANELNEKRYSKFNLKYSQNTLAYILTASSKVALDVKNLLELQLNSKQELIKPIDYRRIFSKRIFESFYFHSYLIKEQQLTSATNKLNKYGTNLVEFIAGQLDTVIEDISTSFIGEVEQIDSIKIIEAAYKTLFFVENGQYEVPLKKASDGTVHYLAIMAALMGSEHDTMAMMFEEPERHMHMKVLSYIVNTMRDNKSQIFFTTHSGEFLKILNQNEIIFMYRDEETGDTKSLNASKIKKLDQIFKKYKYEMTEIIKDGVLGYIGDYDVKE